MLVITPLFLNLGSGEIFLIVLVVVLFFGTDKLPEMVRGFARGMREMKNAASEIQREIETSANEIQRDINLKGHINEVSNSARKITQEIEKGLEDEKPVPPVTVIQVPPTPPASPEQSPPQDDPLTPPNIVGRKG